MWTVTKMKRVIVVNVHKSSNTSFWDDSVPCMATPVMYARHFNSPSVAWEYHSTSINGQALEATASTSSVHLDSLIISILPDGKQHQIRTCICKHGRISAKPACTAVDTISRYQHRSSLICPTILSSLFKSFPKKR